jgi:ankyrin repeat protein
MKRDDEILEQILGDHLPSAPTEEMEADSDRVWNRLRSRVDALPVRRPATLRIDWRPVAVLAAAALVLVAVGLGIQWYRHTAIATLDGNYIRAGETAHSSESGSILKLADGSIVEMRPYTELRLERATDGVMIKLSSGSVIVSAAKQRTGHLYVETKDVKVSVVGTVFLVRADGQGSHVAVVEGEVQVRIGTVEGKLRPRQQLSTSSSMQPFPMEDEISWSRDAKAHMVLLGPSPRSIYTRPEITDDLASFIASAQQGDVDAVRRLLLAGADPNIAVPGDGTPLIVAAGEGHLEVVHLLLDYGADPNLASPGDGNPLIKAAGQGREKVVSMLLDRDADIEAVVPNDENALITASREGQLEVARLLVTRGANVNARVWVDPQTTPSGGGWRTALSEARRKGRQEVVQYLLSVGAQ